MSLKRLGASLGASLYTTLLAGFAVALSQETEIRELLFMTPVACRTSTDLENMQGFFVERVTVPVRLSEDLTFRALVARVRQSATEALTHQETPLEMVLEHLERSGGAPQIEVMFSLQNTPRVSTSFAGLDRMPLPTSEETSNFTPILELYSPMNAMLNLSVAFAESPLGLQGSMEFNARVVDEESASRLVRRIVSTITELVEGPDERVRLHSTL
jgi:non-ribosomal peptide synthetase component F